MWRTEVPGTVNGEMREGGSTVAVVAGIVVVQDVVVSGVAIGFDRTGQRLEVVHDGGHAGLGQIGAVDIAAAAGAFPRRRNHPRRTSCWCRACGFGFSIWLEGGTQRVAVAVAVPDRIGISRTRYGWPWCRPSRIDGSCRSACSYWPGSSYKEHRPCCTLKNSMEVEPSPVRKIVGRRSGVAAGAIAAGADGDFNPRKQVVLAAARILFGDVASVAIRLLPHLVEAVHRAVGIIVVGERRRRKLESALGQVQDVRECGCRVQRRGPGQCRRWSGRHSRLATIARVRFPRPSQGWK